MYKVTKAKYRMIKLCRWSEDRNGNWETKCGELTQGTPKTNKMAFCCYCGGKLIEVAYAKEKGK